MENKKTIFRILLIFTTMIILATSAFVLAFSPKKDLKPSEYGIGISYEAAMQDKKPFVALFYDDWCTYCMRFMPKYKVLSDIYKNKYNFVTINVENEKYSPVVMDYAIGSLPTVYIIDPTIDNRVLISNTIYHDLEKVRTELDRYLRIRSMINK